MPTAGAARVVLPLAWIWPVLIWSRLGAQRHEHGVQALLGSYPAARHRALAEWSAGFALTAATGSVPLLRLAMAGDWQGVASWAGGAVFIPALALALGSLSRTHRLFQALYLPLWYCVFNGLPLLDYMGATRPEGRPAALSPCSSPGSPPCCWPEWWQRRALCAGPRPSRRVEGVARCRPYGSGRPRARRSRDRP